MNRSRKTEIVEDKVVRALLELRLKYDSIIEFDVDSDYSTGAINIRVKGGEPD